MKCGTPIQVINTLLFDIKRKEWQNILEEKYPTIV
jgi:hypothetical protein